MKNSYPNRKIDELERGSNNGNMHEHIAAVANKETLHLVRTTGCVVLTKHAIDLFNGVHDFLPVPTKETLAHNLGYKSTRQMMEQTEIVILPTGAYMHLTIDSDGFWVAWNDKPYYGMQRFSSRQHALTSLREDAESIALQS